MRTPPDLHPDDLAVRENLRDMLVEIRVNAGITQHRLAEMMGRSQGAIKGAELAVNWRVSTVQWWAHHLGVRLILQPDDIPYREDTALLRPSGPVAAMAFDRRALVEGLADARRALEVSHRELAERLGVKERAVEAIERQYDVLLVTPQRYCRALGGSLAIELEEL